MRLTVGLLSTFIAASRHRRLKVLQKSCSDPVPAPYRLRGSTHDTKDLRKYAGAERPGSATQKPLQIDKYQREPTPTQSRFNRANTPKNRPVAGMRHCCCILRFQPTGWFARYPALPAKFLREVYIQRVQSNGGLAHSWPRLLFCARVCTRV